LFSRLPSQAGCKINFWVFIWNVNNGVKKRSLYLYFDDKLVVVVGKVVILLQKKDT
jgi:hypothetical protein